MTATGRGPALLSLLALVGISAQGDLGSCIGKETGRPFACGECSQCTCLPDGNLTRTEACCTRVKFGGLRFLSVPVAIQTQFWCEFHSKHWGSADVGHATLLFVVGATLYALALLCIAVFLCLVVVVTILQWKAKQSVQTPTIYHNRAIQAGLTYMEAAHNRASGLYSGSSHGPPDHTDEEQNKRCEVLPRTGVYAVRA